jgi:hypothetical protein
MPAKEACFINVRDQFRIPKLVQCQLWEDQYIHEKLNRYWAFRLVFAIFHNDNAEILQVQNLSHQGAKILFFAEPLACAVNFTIPPCRKGVVTCPTI